MFEETNVFESIRRSIEFVMNNLGRTILFYLANVIIFIALWFAGSFVWTTLLIDKLEPLTSMSPTEIQAMMPQDILTLIGTEGIWIISGVTAVVIVLFSAFLRLQGEFLPQPRRRHTHPQGVRREGRWYKY